MRRRHNESGFTAVELLITLFVAAAFLIAGYQLFNVVIKDGGQARGESRAANIALDYLRRYSPQTTSPCAPYNPLVNSPVVDDTLSNATISVSVTCPAFTTTGVSKIDAIITYNTPSQTVKYSTFATGAFDVNVKGLVGWWKLNGDGIAAAGGADGTVVNATGGTHGNIANQALTFTNTGYVQINSVLGMTATNATISAWVYSAVTPNNGIMVKVGNNASGYGFGIGNTTFEDTGTKLIILYEGVRWAVTTSTLTTGWRHVALVITAGVPSFYVNGSLIGTYTGTNPIAPVGQSYIGGRASGTARFFTGNVDDARMYNRALSAAEVLGIYNGGYK